MHSINWADKVHKTTILFHKSIIINLLTIFNEINLFQIRLFQIKLFQIELFQIKLLYLQKK